jgi:uncharacterized protein with von Willebrand factor type A (vWA) domain
MIEPGANFASNIQMFCGVLRRDYGFALAPADVRDALRAAEAVGIANPGRVRTALRLVCCTSPESRETFERAYDAFFWRAHPAAQPRTAANRVLESRAAGALGEDVDHPKAGSEDNDAVETFEPAASKRRRPATPAGTTDAQAWMSMLARYSPIAASAEPPELTGEAHDALLIAAARLIASVRAGRSREWRPSPRGRRLDLRRTLRSSLRSAGDPLHVRRFGHPARNPRLVILLDGSRSMSDHRALLLGFAHAMVQRSSRTSVWLFSTGLRDVTRDLRSAHRTGRRVLRELGEAWGGGTRIGGALLDFVRSDGARNVDDDTTVLIFSDGLDAGETDELRRALRDMRSRGARIIWVNPHAALAGFVPSARAMRAALPLLDALVGARDVRDLHDLPERIRRARSRVAP